MRTRTGSQSIGGRFPLVPALHTPAPIIPMLVFLYGDQRRWNRTAAGFANGLVCVRSTSNGIGRSRNWYLTQLKVWRLQFDWRTIGCARSSNLEPSLVTSQAQRHIESIATQFKTTPNAIAERNGEYLVIASSVCPVAARLRPNSRRQSAAVYSSIRPIELVVEYGRPRN